MNDNPPWPQDRLRNLIDGLDNVRIALQQEASVVQYGPEYFAQFIRAADFLRELEAIIRAEAKPRTAFRSMLSSAASRA